MQAQVLTESLACTVAARELAELGITASPADISAWLSADQRQRRRLALSWASYVANGWASPAS
jgi:hypothetical protein